jgi:hypothetical protein
MRLRPHEVLWCAAGAWLVMLGGCGQEIGPVRSVVDVPAAEVAPAEAFDRSRFKVLDSLAFITAGRSYELIVLCDTSEDLADASLSYGVRPVLLYERTQDERHIRLHNDSVVLAGTQGGIFGDPYAGVEFSADTLRFFHNGGSSLRWGYTLEFVYGHDGDWPLVRRTSVWYHTLEPDSTMETTDKDMRPSGKHLGNWSSYQ